VGKVFNVMVEKNHLCTAYETLETINEEKFCYEKGKGICIPKNEITNDASENVNCAFIDNNETYYYIIKGNLYSISNYAFRKIKKSGIYIVDNEKKVFENAIERKAIAYECKIGVCNIKENLDTGYYLNMINNNIDIPIILYYNGENKTWRLTNKEGIYLFNNNGYPVGENDEVAFAYTVGSQGEVISSIKENYTKGIYINDANINENILIEFNNSWGKGNIVPTCNIVEEKISLENKLNIGDICISDGKMVLISAISDENKNEEEINYLGIFAENNEMKYKFINETGNLFEIEKKRINKLDLNGYVVLDKEKLTAFTSIEAKEADIYKCINGKCNEFSVEKLKAGERIINILSKENPLLKYIGDEQWAVENEKGYYFYNIENKFTGNNNIVSYAIEVDEFGQKNIIESSDVGYYINNASENKIIVGNSKYFWDKGSEIVSCNITTTEKGLNCKTFKDGLNSGSYCISSNAMYLLLKDIDENSEDVNCVTGTNEEPRYITSDKIETLNGINIQNKLVKVTDQSIKIVEPGIYILNENGTIVDNNGKEGEIKLNIYVCTEDECSNISSNKNYKFYGNPGYIYEMNEKGILLKVEKEGLYFFDSNGIACTDNACNVGEIVKITKSEEKEIVYEKVEIDSLEEGRYINACDNKSFATYRYGNWSIEEAGCSYNEDSNSCIAEGEKLVFESLCIVNGTIYYINEIVEDLTKCKKVNDETPLIFVIDNDILLIKESKIEYMKDEGYYAIDEIEHTGFISSEPRTTLFLKCSNRICEKVETPIANSAYKNNAVNNIVRFNENAEIDKVVTSETQCEIKEGKCSIIGDTEIASNDICIADNSLFLMKEENECVKVEKYIESYQFINNKIYKMNDDNVIQMFDGYYFINKYGRSIEFGIDYSDKNTIGYMCSVKGDCYPLDPDGIRYYKDYTTISNGKFRVVKYDKSKISKRDEEETYVESSGYEILTKVGIYKLDDGSYANCEYSNNDEILCMNINVPGSMITIDNEVFVCSNEDNNNIKCEKAINGGYYFFDHKLRECDVNLDGDKLECKEIRKEGLFLADNKNSLYECKAKEDEKADISRVIDGLIDMSENKNKTVDIEEKINIQYEKRDENDEEVIESTTTLLLEDEEEIIEETDVNCYEIDCANNYKVIRNGIELYACERKVKSEEGNDTNNEVESTPIGTDNNSIIDEEGNPEWVTKCDSGNYVKNKNNYYKCEDEKGKIEEEYIEKPNTEHTSTDKKEPLTTETTTTTTTSTSISKDSTSITSTTIDNASTSTNTNTSNTKTKTTTTPTPTATTTVAGAASARKISSPYIYIFIIFIVLFLMQ